MIRKTLLAGLVLVCSLFLGFVGCSDFDGGGSSGSGGSGGSGGGVIGGGGGDGIICSCGEATSTGIDLCSEGTTDAECDGGITANCPATSYRETSCLTSNPGKHGALCCFAPNNNWTMYMWDTCSHPNCDEGFRTACANEGGSVGACPTSSASSGGGGGGGGGGGTDPAPLPCETNNTGTITFWVSNGNAVEQVNLTLHGVGSRSSTQYVTDGSPECGSTSSVTKTFADIGAGTYTFRAEDQDNPPRVWEGSATVNQCACTSFELY